MCQLAQRLQRKLSPLAIATAAINARTAHCDLPSPIQSLLTASPAPPCPPPPTHMYVCTLRRLAPLSEGRLLPRDTDGGGGVRLACAYHGWEFERSGACAKIPQVGRWRGGWGGVDGVHASTGLLHTRCSRAND